MDSVKQEKHTARRHDGRTVSRLFSSSGASLLIIIISILVIAFLAAGMYAFTSTSLFNQVSAQNAMKAQYLADAGPRIAVSEIRGSGAPGTPGRVTAMLNLNQSDFAVGNGRVQLQIFPFWFYAANNIAQGTAAPVLNMPGNLPRPIDGVNPIPIPQSGLLKRAGDPRVAQYNGVVAVDPAAQGQPAQVTFTVPGGIPFNVVANTDTLMIGFVQNEAGDPIFPAAQLNVPVTLGGNLLLNTAGDIARFFPAANANFTLATAGGVFIYHYDNRRINGDGTTTLTNIRPVPGEAWVDFTPIFNEGNLLNVAEPNMSTHIYVGGANGNTLGIRSTGIVN